MGLNSGAAGLGQREVIISKYISTPQGRAALAKAMSQPGRTVRDYTKCIGCSAPIVLEPGSRDHMKHPSNGCELQDIFDVMET
jgi:hypothetical protein